MIIRLKAALVAGVSLSVIGACAGAAWAADAPASSGDPIATNANAVAEITVTAQRRTESVQKVPMTVQAFTGQTLSQLNITTLDDLLKYTPNVTFANNGPGQGEITMRGLSSGFRGDQSSATIGNFPNVAVYLDDESMQFPGRNLDVYMVDMARVEVLEGPQGTLFGGGAEAGAVRYITNKPKLNTFEGEAEAAYGFTSGGDPNTSAHATINIPVIQDKLAVRAVIYDERQGGYITNEASTFTRSNMDPGNFNLGITPGAPGGLCPNILPAGPGTSKYPNGLCTVAGAPVGNNYALAGKGENPATYTGARFSALYQINPDWDVLISESFQNLDAEGLSVEYPTGSDFQTLKPLHNTMFSPSYDKDHYENTSWTLNGKIGDIRAIYTGSWLDRHISQQMDYTNYTRTGSGTYYSCTGGATGWGSGPAKCYSPVTSWQDTVENTHLSNEIRFSSPDNWRLRFIAGAFNEEFRIYDVMNFNYKTAPSCTPANLAAASPTNPCIGDVQTAPGSTANQPGVRGDATAFGEDVQRGYDQTAIFGSIDFDIIPKVLTFTAGTRWFDYNEFEVGSVYSTGTGCLNVANGACFAGEKNINSHHDKVTYTGFKSRFGLTWHPSTNTTLYYLFSQGFRPGGFNRYQKSVITDPATGSPQYLEPNAYAPDSLTNNEIGLKTQFFDHRLQLNLSAYYMTWTNVQLLQYNPTEGINTTFASNGPAYQIKGVEAQWVAKVAKGLTVQGSATYNDDTQSSSPCLTNNAEVGQPGFGKCITQVQLSNGTVQPFSNPYGAVGSTPAFSPAFQGNLRARYEWSIGEFTAHAMIGGNYMGKMFNQPADYPSGTGVAVPYTTYLRYEQPAYGTIDASIGVSKDKWYAELYGTNLTDSHASVFTSSAQFIKSEVPLRPTVIMLKIGARF